MTQTTTKDETRVEKMHDRIRSMYEAKLNELKRSALYLSEKMQRTAANCDRALEKLDEPTYTNLNTLGEVQSLGNEIDRNCGELDHLYQVLQMLRYDNRTKK
jgi:hypothetical protein